MSRTLRLFACAAGMLALAVLACLLLQDGETVKSGGQEVSGKISDSAEARSRAEVSEAEAGRREERAGVARVKVLELAKAAAENKARAEAAPAEKPEAVPAEAPKAEAAGSEAVRNEAVEAEALALIRGEMPAPEARPLPVEKPSEARPEAPSAEKAEKAVAAEPVKETPKPVVQKAEVKKAEAKKAPEKKAEEKKPAAKKAEVKPSAVSKPEPKKPARQLSAVESALEDARSGRLSPVEDVLVSSDPAKTYDRVVTSAKFSMKGSLIKLTLRGNSPMIGHFYVLEDPDRVVLDLAGNWQIEVPKVPSNRLIGAVRVGQHEDKTRLVFDMKNPGKAALVPLNRNALELRIQ